MVRTTRLVTDAPTPEVFGDLDGTNAHHACRARLFHHRLMIVVAMVGLAACQRPSAPLSPQQMTTPQDSWRALLVAMSTSNMDDVRLLTTPAGLSSLQKYVAEGCTTAEQFRQWADAWSPLTVWWSDDEKKDDRRGYVGDFGYGIIYVQVGGHWKLDKFIPGMK